MESNGGSIASLNNLIGAVDQGTGSSRFLVFDSETAEIVTYHQIETNQLTPKVGWVEQDPFEIISSVKTCIEKTVEKLKELEINPCKIRGIGITNQRESIVVWNKYTGKPLSNAIIWLDTRNIETVELLNQKKGSKAVKEKCGLPISTYFSAVKLKWLIDNRKEVKAAVKHNTCLFGTIDSWIIWNLTGGVSNGIHVTDVTNASRTMLMNIRHLEWDPWLCNFFEIPVSILPTIHSSSEILGYLNDGPLIGVPISGCMGDQSAALVGQLCFEPGSAKNTYGTGCFLLCNTGRIPISSKHGLLTTVAYQLGPNKPAMYALEGSVAIAGALIRWLRDNLGVIQDTAYIETLASSVDSTHGVYFVPAFSGLYAPYWQPDARGIICGLTTFSTRAHIARAALEAVCFQISEIVEAMNLDSGFPLEQLQVDGGMTSNTLLMQIQADLLGFPVVMPSLSEITALGVAMAAGAAQGINVWDIESTIMKGVTTETFYPSISAKERKFKCALWKKAVKRSMKWEDETTKTQSVKNPVLLSLPGSFFLFSSFALLVLAEAYEKL